MSKKLDILMTYWSADVGNLSLIGEIVSQLTLEGRVADVINFINKLTPEQRNADVVLLQHVQILLKGSDFVSAQQLLVSFQPKTEMGVAEKSYLFGLSCFLQGDLVSALNLLVSAPTKSISNLKLQARILYLQSKRVEALRVLEPIADENVDAEILGLMSLILVDEAQDTAAVRYANAALAQNSEQVDALIAFATISIQQQQFQTVPQFINAALAVMPGQGRIWSLHGQYLLQDGQLSEAESSLKTAIQLMPEHVGTQLLLGWSLWLQEKYPESLSAFQRSVDLDRNFAESHAGLAVAQLKNGETDEAQRSVVKATKLNPLSLASKYAQALLLEHDGLQGDATQKINEIMQMTHYSGQNSNLDVVRRVLSDRQGR